MLQNNKMGGIKSNLKFLYILLILIQLHKAASYKVIFAKNFGGEEVLTENGILYDNDSWSIFSTNKILNNDEFKGDIPVKEKNIFKTLTLPTQHSRRTFNISPLDDGEYIMFLKLVTHEHSSRDRNHENRMYFFINEDVIGSLNEDTGHGLLVPVEIQKRFTISTNTSATSDQKVITNKNEQMFLTICNRAKVFARLSGILILKIEIDETIPESSWLLPRLALRSNVTKATTNKKKLTSEVKRYIDQFWEHVASKSETNQLEDLKTDNNIVSGQLLEIKEQLKAHCQQIKNLAIEIKNVSKLNNQERHEMQNSEPKDFVGLEKLIRNILKTEKLTCKDKFL
jgi:hypothetical protein